jgi:Protein of unknown function (DUF2934)
MTPKDRPLYGELVAGLARQEEESTADEELHEMEYEVRHMIEEAAYYIAEKRGFHPGYEMQDWLEAEKQVKARLGLDK